MSDNSSLTGYKFARSLKIQWQKDTKAIKSAYHFLSLPRVTEKNF